MNEVEQATRSFKIVKKTAKNYQDKSTSSYRNRFRRNVIACVFEYSRNVVERLRIDRLPTDRTLEEDVLDGARLRRARVAHSSRRMAARFAVRLSNVGFIVALLGEVVVVVEEVVGQARFARRSGRQVWILVVVISIIRSEKYEQSLF